MSKLIRLWRVLIFIPLFIINIALLSTTAIVYIIYSIYHYIVTGDEPDDIKLHHLWVNVVTKYSWDYPMLLRYRD